MSVCLSVSRALYLYVILDIGISLSLPLSLSNVSRAPLWWLSQNSSWYSRSQDKTASIIDIHNTDYYERKPCEEILSCTKQETKTIVIARFGMLECGRNFKGSNSITCNESSTVDDEEHRLNYCKKFRAMNYYDYEQKIFC